YGASKEKSVVIYPAVKKDLISRSDCKRESTLRILSVGRDHWKKGYRVALDAMKILKDEDFRFHYTIVSGGEKEELIHQIHQLGLSDCVTLIDNLPHASVIDKYRKSDVFLLPSFEEGVANVVLEAMALGVPVISTDCGGMAEVIRDGENGFLIPLRNPQAIRDAIMKVSCLDTARTEDIISNAHDTIRKRHIVDIQVEQMLKLYRHVKEA
ncbi:MAG: glycosyltransferase family 4 protein, partial [Muribaculaceae bacterium]|nr:glycosyltransferase family 4 protein [Muribaculaceae bacterium]